MNHSKMKLSIIIIVYVKSAGIYIMKQYIYSNVIFEIKGSEYNIVRINMKKMTFTK